MRRGAPIPRARRWAGRGRPGRAASPRGSARGPCTAATPRRPGRPRRRAIRSGSVSKTPTSSAPGWSRTTWIWSPMCMWSKQSAATRQAIAGAMTSLCHIHLDFPMRRHVSTPVPAYIAIERALREDIARMQPGDAIPTESQLCERFGVSRMTARAGVARLVDQGLLYRTRGKGTFVAQPHVHRQAGRLRSFSQDMLARGLRPSSRILEIAQEAAPPDVADGAAAPRRRARDPHPARAPRRRAADGARADAAAARVRRGARRRPRARVAARGARRRSATRRRWRAARSCRKPPRSRTPRRSTCRSGEPLLVETRLVYDAEDTPIERTESRYSPSRYVLDIELRAAAE